MVSDNKYYHSQMNNGNLQKYAQRTYSTDRRRGRIRLCDSLKKEFITINLACNL